MLSGTERTLLASFSTGQTTGADNADDVALSGGPAGLDVAWDNNDQSIWTTGCASTCATPAAQADHARSGGTDNGENFRPFYPPQASAATLPTRVYWTTFSPLDPSDTNTAPDIYGWDLGNTTYDNSIHLMSGGQELAGTDSGSADNDGGVTLFESSGSNLPGSNGLLEQVYVRRAGVDTNVSQPPGQPPRTDSAGDGYLNPLHQVNDDGSEVTFTSDAPAFGSVPGLLGPPEQVIVRNLVTGQTTLASVGEDKVTTGNLDSSDPSIDAAGNLVVFSSRAQTIDVK